MTNSDIYCLRCGTEFEEIDHNGLCYACFEDLNTEIGDMDEFKDIE